MKASSSDAVQAGLVLGCGAATAAAGMTLRAPQDQVSDIGLEGALGIALSLLGLAVVALWLLALTVAVAAELLRRGGRPTAAHITTRFTPSVMHRLAAMILGVHLLAVPAASHAATVGPGPEPPSSTAHAAVLLNASSPATGAPAESGACFHPFAGSRGEPVGSPRWLPVAVTAPGAPAAAEEQPPAPVSPLWRLAPVPTDGGLLLRPDSRSGHQPREVVVAPGDSLWSIVAGRLGPLATAADVAEAWPAWFDTNRSIIGDDPSFILPGQILHAPPP